MEGASASAPAIAAPSGEEQPVAPTADAAETSAPSESEVHVEVEQCPTPAAAGEAQSTAAGDEPTAIPTPAADVFAEEAPAACSHVCTMAMTAAAEGAESEIASPAPAPAEAKEAEANAPASPPADPEKPEDSEAASAEGTGTQPPQASLRLSASTEDDTQL